MASVFSSAKPSGNDLGAAMEEVNKLLKNATLQNDAAIVRQITKLAKTMEERLKCEGDPQPRRSARTPLAQHNVNSSAPPSTGKKGRKAVQHPQPPTSPVITPKRGGEAEVASTPIAAAATPLGRENGVQSSSKKGGSRRQSMDVVTSTARKAAADTRTPLRPSAVPLYGINRRTPLFCSPHNGLMFTRAKLTPSILYTGERSSSSKSRWSLGSNAMDLGSAAKGRLSGIVDSGGGSALHDSVLKDAMLGFCSPEGYGFGDSTSAVKASPPPRPKSLAESMASVSNDADADDAATTNENCSEGGLPMQPPAPRLRVFGKKGRKAGTTSPRPAAAAAAAATADGAATADSTTTADYPPSPFGYSAFGFGSSSSPFSSIASSQTTGLFTIGQKPQPVNKTTALNLRRQHGQSATKSRRHAAGCSSATSAAPPKMAAFDTDTTATATAAGAVAVQQQPVQPQPVVVDLGHFLIERAQQMAIQAEAALALKEQKRALESLSFAIRLAPESWPYKGSLYSGRGSGLLEYGYYEAAIVDLKRALAYPAPRTRDMVLLGRAQQRLGQFVEADSSFREALCMVLSEQLSASDRAQLSDACDTGMAEAYAGMTALRSAETAAALTPERMLQAADAVLQVGPRCATAHCIKAVALCKLRRWAECAAFCEEHCRVPPASIQQHESVEYEPWPTVSDSPGALALSLPADAARCYIRALYAHPDESKRSGAVAAARAVVHHCLSLQQQQQQQHWAQADLSKFEQSQELFKAGVAALTAQVWHDALQKLSAALTLDVCSDAQHAKMLCMRATASHALGQYSDAIADCDKALQCAPTATRALLVKARAIAASSSVSAALAAYAVYTSACGDRDVVVAEEIRQLQQHVARQQAAEAEQQQRAAAAVKAAAEREAVRERAAAATAAARRAQADELYEQEMRRRATAAAAAEEEEAAKRAKASYNNSSSSSNRRDSGGGSADAGTTRTPNTGSRSSRYSTSSCNRPAAGVGGGAKPTTVAAAAATIDTSSYYSVLGVDKRAPKTAIKQAYKKLILQWHPDKNNDPAAGTAFRTIHEAYKVLTSPESRSMYDAEQSIYTGVSTTPYGSRRNSNNPPPRYRY
jgi:DnaJ domain